MKTTGNTILITGGSSGIGLAMVREFVKRNNKVIIAGRSEEKLKEVSNEFKEVEFIVADLSVEAEAISLIKIIERDFPQLNVLINNAGFAHQYTLSEHANSYQKAKAEMELNFLAPVLLTEKLLPILSQQQNSAIINVSSIAGYSPNLYLPTYSASKAALHSFTQILRLTLSIDSPVKIVELLPPAVGAARKRDSHDGLISAEEVALELIEGLESDTEEIRAGATAAFYNLMLQSPEKALLIRNKMSDEKL